jgi:hypothetical protein
MWKAWSAEQKAPLWQPTNTGAGKAKAKVKAKR